MLPVRRFFSLVASRLAAPLLASLLSVGSLSACGGPLDAPELVPADEDALAVSESELALSASSCEGRTCFGHGTCVMTGGKAACVCEAGYYAAGLSCLPGATDPGRRYVPAGYRLIFSDEFTDGKLDTTKWSTRAPWNVQWYEDSNQLQAFIPRAVTLSGGVAQLTADRSQGDTAGQPYSSGSITTHRTFTYGYIEARVKVPAGKGFWPAFWLTSSTRWPPEWDIFEIVNGVNHGYPHPAPGGKVTFIGGAAGEDARYTVPNQYGVNHVYGFKWTPTNLVWHVDGVITEHYAANAASGVGDAFWVNLSLTVGGDWPGAPDASTPFPSTMSIDYLRVYQPG
ncbi:MAG: glycosyl hydrolase family protein [Polyangiaceae bacterium]|nr:glycosyl hydrolase family protein [Polyangiaceae bacterium]